MPTVAKTTIPVETPKLSKKDKKEQAIQRVQTEFLRQIGEGVDKKEAFKNSLKAIDEKYNPQADKFECSKELADTANQKLKACKMAKIDPKTAESWLKLIEKAIPVILSMGTMVGKFVDWILEHKAPKNEQDNLQENLASPKLSTTA